MPLDHDRLRARLEDITRAVKRLRRLHLLDRQAFLADEDSQDIARSRLLTAIEAALNICYHVAAKRLGRVPESYAECFTVLGENGLLDPPLADRLALMAQFRNRLVHLYWGIDYSLVYDIIVNDIDDLDRFSAAMAALL